MDVIRYYVTSGQEFRFSNLKWRISPTTLLPVGKYDFQTESDVYKFDNEIAGNCSNHAATDRSQKVKNGTYGREKRYVVTLTENHKYLKDEKWHKVARKFFSSIEP